MTEAIAAAASHVLAHKGTLRPASLKELAWNAWSDAFSAHRQGISGHVAVRFRPLRSRETLQGLSLFMEIPVEPKPCSQAV